ncbi:MAG TPA: MBL fold metallo-hydrolase [Lysobacter sp.]
MPVLRARGVRRLDRMVVSHADLDHAGGLDAVRRDMRADDLLAPDGAGVPGARPCLAGTSWTWDGVRFVVLHPPRHFPYLGNEASCVIRVETRHGAVLLTGDIGADIEARLAAMQPAALRADAVFVPHHGSRHSSSEAFARATGARLAIVSAGHANRFRHPNAQVVERWRAAGAQVVDTAGSGAVTLRSGPAGIVAERWRDRRPRLWDAARRAAADAGLSYRRD